MATTKIWNISDGPNPKVAPQNVMVMGKLLKPGQAMVIDDAKLKTAHKVREEAASGILHIGKKAPKDYLMMKHPEHRKLAPGVGRSQGAPKVAAPAPAKPAPVVQEPKKEEPKKDPEGGLPPPEETGTKKKRRG